MSARFEEYYTSMDKWGRRATYGVKMGMARYYVWDHHDELCLAFDDDHVIYYQSFYTDLCGCPSTDGGWINIKHANSVLDYIDIKSYKKIHLILFNTPFTPLQRKVLDDIVSEAKTMSSTHPELVAEVLGW